MCTRRWPLASRRSSPRPVPMPRLNLAKEEEGGAGVAAKQAII
jgi:hypothetical protein